MRLPTILIAAIAVTAGSVSIAAQERPIDQGVRVGITYAPGTLPGMLVLGGPRTELTDSVRTIIQRDLDYSDRFELIVLPGGDSIVVVVEGDGEDAVSRSANYSLYDVLGSEWTVAFTMGTDSTLLVSLLDVHGMSVRRSWPIQRTTVDDPEFRMSVHRISDEIVRATTGSPGMAASRLLFVRDGRLYRVDSDGADLTRVPAPGNAYSPVWGPDGRTFAFVDFPGDSKLLVTSVRSGQPPVEHYLGDGQHYAPAFTPDGRSMVVTKSDDEGTDLYQYNLEDSCCLRRLTIGRFSDNLSPTFSPDGSRIAYVSTRVGLPQIYSMASDGTGQELFAPYDYGVTGASYAPEWSPDGLNLAFHRDIRGVPQVFLMDVASKVVRQLSSEGRNEDPTWAPDGRHIAYASTRSGSSQIWVIDVETGRIRQLTRIGGARLPAWSPRVSETN